MRSRTLTWTWILCLGIVTGCSGGSADAGSAADFGEGTAAPTGSEGRAARPSQQSTPPPDGDEYEAPGTNPFVHTAHDPFSTFAVDVDTASYDIFVRDVQDRYVPDPDSVRLEEYVNYFDYDYAAPEPGAETPFDIHLKAADHPMGRQLAQLRVGIQAEAPPPFEKKPANLVFLVDVSGSMDSPQKLPLVKVLLTETLDVLEETDRVAIVTYAAGTDVRLESTEVAEQDRIEASIQGLGAGGSTAGSRGIQRAYDQVERGFIEGGHNHVVLCTDGDFNVGITDRDELVELIEEKRRSGVTLTALGFGRGNLNDAMMERVSNAGNGIYSVITDEDHAARYADEDILNTVTHVAKDVKIQLELNEEHVTAYRLLGYENRAIADEDFRDDTVDAGEIGAGHQVTALYELVLEGQAVPEAEDAPEIEDGEPVEGEREVDPAELVRVKVRYKNVDAGEEDPAHEVAESLTPEQVREDLAAHDDRDFLWAAAIASFAEILKQSPYADEDDLDRIAEIAAADAGRDAKRKRFEELFTTARDLLGKR